MPLLGYLGDALEVGVVVEHCKVGKLGGRSQDEVRDRYTVLASHRQQLLNLTARSITSGVIETDSKLLRSSRIAR